MKTFKDFFLENKDKYKIYIDLDGVITNFNKAVKDMGYGPIENLEKNPPKMWALITSKGIPFWQNMEWLEDGKKLWQLLQPYNPTILTARIKDPKSVTGKHIWIEKNFGKDFKNYKIVSRKNKQLFASPSSILIDDKDKNINEWKEAGGIGILYTDFDSTKEILKKYLPLT
jgi:5'(3')-deoxyribonucleotidase